METEQIQREIPETGGYKISPDGSVFNKKGQLIKPIIRNSGRLVVGLTINGKLKWELVHRLVAQAFVPNPDKLTNVCHIDSDCKNNNASNLRWFSYGSR